MCGLHCPSYFPARTCVITWLGHRSHRGSCPGCKIRREAENLGWVLQVPAMDSSNPPGRAVLVPGTQGTCSAFPEGCPRSLAIQSPTLQQQAFLPIGYLWQQYTSKTRSLACIMHKRGRWEEGCLPALSCTDLRSVSEFQREKIALGSHMTWTGWGKVN